MHEREPTKVFLRHNIFFWSSSVVHYSGLLVGFCCWDYVRIFVKKMYFFLSCIPCLWVCSCLQCSIWNAWRMYLIVVYKTHRDIKTNRNTTEKIMRRRCWLSIKKKHTYTQITYCIYENVMGLVFGFLYARHQPTDQPTNA